MLAAGGNAMDAAVATNLTLGVVTPYLCGFGGDVFALVWDGGPFAYNGSGRAPAGASVEAVRAAVGGTTMPERGPLTVTVPGAVEGWFALLERFGSLPFEELARPALRYARDGFVLSSSAGESIARAGELFVDSSEWQAVYGAAGAGSILRQQDLASTIEVICSDGPSAYYRGEIGRSIAEHVRSLGGLMAPEDLMEHHGGWVEPLRATYRDVKVMELPPNTQGVTALHALVST